MHWSWSWPLVVRKGGIDSWLHVVALHPLLWWNTGYSSSRSSLGLARRSLHLFIFFSSGEISRVTVRNDA